MKKLNYFLLGLGALALASCSQDAPFNPAEGDGNVSFNISLPSDALGTRAAIGSGSAATQLYYAVYEVSETSDTSTPATGKFQYAQNVTPTYTNYNTTLSINLLTGKNYNIVFFAYAPDAAGTLDDTGALTGGVYNIVGTAGTLTVDYSQMNSSQNNNDVYDCFYTMVNTGEITSSSSSFEAKLKRPMAQINWGTDDMDATLVQSTFGTNGANVWTTLSVNAANTLDLQTGAVSTVETAGSTESTFTLGAFKAPDAQDYPVENYNYVGMQYILAPSASSTTVDLTLNIANAQTQTGATYTKEIPVNSAPVQANYQTNIYGTLLSNGVVANIELVPGFNTPANDYAITPWDGTTKTYPTIPASTETPVQINKPSDLAGLADMVNGNNLPAGVNPTFAGYTFELAADVDMGGNDFPGIGTGTRSSAASNGNSFKGVFDGKGNTIKNVNISFDGTDKNTVVGFIPNLEGADAALQNVTFENLSIEGGSSEQAGVVGMLTGGATVSNVTVKSGSVSAQEGAGGIVGRLTQNGTVENCNNSADITVTQQNGGGIVGAAYYTSLTGDGMLITGCTNTGNVTATSSSAVAVGGIVGLSAATIESCTNKGAVTGVQNSVGGIVGAQQSAGYIRNCVNEGPVTAPNPTMGVGGIVGWIKYLNTDAYPKENVIEVTGCTNYADVSGNNGVGGIVGSWYRAGVCSNNNNYAEKLHANTGFVAGIIGSSQFLDDKNGPAPNKVENYVDMLYVENNTTTTTWDNMEGTLKSWIVYVNSSKNVTLSGNTPNQTADGQDDITSN